MKIDPYKHKERYLAWKESVGGQIPDMSKTNSDVILHYLNNMEHGINVSVKSPKGVRSHVRLNNIRDKMTFFARSFQEVFAIDDITRVSEEQLLQFFSDMKTGVFTKKDGTKYRSVDTYAKIFRAFWNWWIKVNKKKGKEIPNITYDLDTKQDQSPWVYLTEKEVKTLAEHSPFDYKVLILFLYDTGMRAPTELMNIRVSDIYGDCKEVQVREEASKTFGRRIKLMICSQLLSQYIKSKELTGDDVLFDIKPYTVNKYLQRKAEKLFGRGVSLAGEAFSKMTMYDLRHCSCCYWLPRYKSESALKYRFGWKKSDKIHYYSGLLGMKDTIQEEDMLVDVTKTELEKELTLTKKENAILNERVDSMEKQMKEILVMLNKVSC